MRIETERKKKKITIHLGGDTFFGSTVLGWGHWKLVQPGIKI